MIYFILKFKKSVILNTQFLELKYHIPNIKYPEILYIQKPRPTLVRLKVPTSPK